MVDGGSRESTAVITENGFHTQSRVSVTEDVFCTKRDHQLLMVYLNTIKFISAEQKQLQMYIIRLLHVLAQSK